MGASGATRSIGNENAVLQARASFQRLLDERFPKGAYCAGFVAQGERMRPTGLEFRCGRVLCSAAKAVSGGWHYELLLDPRASTADERDPHRFWISDLVVHGTMPGVWEAWIVSSNGDSPRVLRMNADPPVPWRPTREMRRLIDDAHRALLEPQGID